MLKKILYTSFVFVYLLNVKSLKAQLVGYSFIQPITVSNTSTTSAINYQLKLTLNTQALISAGQMLATGNDIRFGKNCAGSTLYNYWIESGINTPTTTIWVKIDTISAGASRTFFMYYGNSSATAVSSVSLTFIYSGSATDSVASGAAGGTGDSQRGFRFSPNIDILVTKFGKYEPTGTPRYVTLFDQTTTNIIAQQIVNGSAATYSYTNLPSPIWLTQGTQYNLQLFQATSDGYYFGTSTAIDPHLTYYDMQYCNSCTQNTFPNSTLSGYHYGYPDFEFYYKNNITPSPSYSLSSIASVSISITGANLICSGETTTLSVVGASSYTWNTTATTSSITVTPSLTTTFSVSGLSTAGSCPRTAMITVTVNPTPTISVTSGSICIGGAYTITASGASSYTYNSGSAIVSPTTTSTYSVTGSSTEGCVSAIAISTVVVNTCVGINEIEFQNSVIKVYPNPSNGLYIIETLSNTKVEVTDMLGKIIYSQVLEKGMQQLDFTSLPSGLYILKAQQNNTSSIVKLKKI